MELRCTGWVLGLLILIGVGALGGCGRSAVTPRPDPVAPFLPKGPRSDALILLRRILPRAVTCPATIELTQNEVSWVDIHSCQPTDLRRGLRFQDIQAARLILLKVHMGFDQRWVEVLHNRAWVPIGRGMNRLRGKKGKRILEGVKAALERLGPGRETPHKWNRQARPYLF